MLLFADCCLLLVGWCSVLFVAVACCLLLAVRCLLLVVICVLLFGYSLLVVCCRFGTVVGCWWLLVGVCRLRFVSCWLVSVLC